MKEKEEGEQQSNNRNRFNKKILESARTGAEYEEKVLYRAEIEDAYCPFGQNEIIKDLAEVSSMKNYARFFFSPPTPTEKKFWFE